MNDSTTRLRSATRRAKSDVANKLISMCLHTLSRMLLQKEKVRIDDEEYINAVRTTFSNLCPYCSRTLDGREFVVEHLDGLNRLRAGLHVSGNVLIACKQCNNEKRRDDSLEQLSLADSGWESFLSHDGTRCPDNCKTCRYWSGIWPDTELKRLSLGANRKRLTEFRTKYLSASARDIRQRIAPALTRMYKKCQSFADQVIEEFVAQVTTNTVEDDISP